MVISSSIDNIIKPQQVAGVDIYISPEGSYTCNTVILKRNKNAIELVNQQKDIKGIDELKLVISPKIPLSIVLNGKGILHKKIEISQNDTEASMLGKILPNAKPEGFFLFKHIINDGLAFVSVVRKNMIEPIIDEIKKNEFDVINVSLGPFVVSQMLPLINVGNDPDLKLQHCNIQLGEAGIIDFKLSEVNKESEVKVGNDPISNYLIIAFAASFKEFVAQAPETDMPLVSELKKSFKSKRIFQLAGAALLVFYLLVLSINYIVYSYYDKQARKLSAEVDVSKEILSDLEKIKKDLNEKSAIMNKTGLLQAGRTSLFADRIARVIPSSIQLKEMSLNPLIKDQNDDKNILFDINTVIIKGGTKKNTELNEFIKEIKKMDWVKDVTLVNFTQDKEKNTGDFNIEVRIK